MFFIYTYTILLVAYGENYVAFDRSVHEDITFTQQLRASDTQEVFDLFPRTK